MVPGGPTEARQRWPEELGEQKTASVLVSQWPGVMPVQHLAPAQCVLVHCLNWGRGGRQAFLHGHAEQNKL